MSGPARDRAAEIDAAITAVTGTGPVTVDTGGAPRRVRFEHAPQPVPAESWLPFTGRAGELAVAGDTLRVGLGARGAMDPGSPSAIESARTAALAAGGCLTGGDVEVRVPEGCAELVAALVDGLAAGCRAAQPVRLLLPADHLADARRGLLAAAVARLAAALVSAPANLLTPHHAAEWAGEIADRAGLDCTVLGPEELVAQGFGGLAAIGAGSVNGPRLVRLRYSVPGGGPVLALVGKGITFDSGGLSLKSPAAMQSMRLDVAGAATVLAVMAGLRAAGCPISVQAVLPFAENLPGPGAMRPGDVVTAWNGTEVQLLDLDFEGRVVLADALALAAADRPDLLVDLATLTYQAEIALGPDIAAVLGRDDAAVEQLLAAASAAGEPMWRLPWAARYADQVRTSSGVRNHPLHDSGRALTAALFLGEFVPRDVPWVHCDMTGPAWRGDASRDGGTGFGARTLLTLTERMAVRPASTGQP
ncbi:M17 family metallopeptidase [Blastococcus mobilis]|uniref:Probable cytosol aminopeptidase n=1 Tax=Blastococcus mobilis TaxID=1938746 RepID=A0A239A9U1_9ACTN|nr:M17 family metallopeptidase [Blastococcus mobilis]SNR91848.1 leucyl aminopeptidase [Blastococcus mobilis]